MRINYKSIGKIKFMHLLLVFLVVFLHVFNANASLAPQNELCEGVHQYRIKFFRNNNGEEGSLTLLGCHHYMRLESLPSAQQHILANDAAQSAEVYNERTDKYLNRKIHTYIDVLQKIADNPEVLESNFFDEYARTISHETRHSPVHPHVSVYFSRILNQKLKPGFLGPLEINLSETSLEAIRRLAQPETVEKLPLRLVYDFTSSYIKRTSLEYQMIDQYRASHAVPRVYALDETNERQENEEALFNEVVDFTPVRSESVRSRVLSFYGDLSWMFDEHAIYSVIPQTLAQQVQALCCVSDDMKQRINNGTLLRILQEDLAVQNCSALMRMGLKSTISSYLGGAIVLGTSAENVVERTYTWLRGALLNAITETQSLVIFGDSHLISAGNNRGVLQFFMDLLSREKGVFWNQTLGDEAFHAWQNITVQSVERLTKEGIYHTISN